MTAVIPSGFDAMGHPVPADRLSAAYRAVKDMLPGVSTEDAMALVGRVAHHLENDEPYKAMKEATGAPLPRHVSSAEPPHRPDPEIGVRLDLTGGYRLLATLLAATVGGAS